MSPRDGWRAGALLIAIGLALATCSPPEPALGGRLIDLSHAFDSGTIYWPTDTRGFELEILEAGITDKGYYYAANRFATAEHGGTHIDAPRHFAEGRHTVDEIPLERLIGPGVLVDVSTSAGNDPDYEVSVADLKAWEDARGRIPEGALVLLRTGHGRHWANADAYLGTRERGPEAVPQLHFPGLHPEAARWLVDQRRIASIGIDTPSIDRGQSELFESHQILFASGVPAFENLARLDELPATGFSVIALPMKIRGGSGGPLRAVAIVP